MEGLKPPPYSGIPKAGAIPSQSHAPEEAFDSVFHSYLHILVKRKYLIVGAIVAALGLALFVNLTQTPIYQASTELVIEPKLSGEAGQEALAANLMRDPTFFMTQTRLLRGPKFSQRVINLLTSGEQLSILNASKKPGSLSLQENGELSPEDRQALAGIISGAVALRQVATGARILELSTVGFVPDVCALLANTAAEAYVLVNHESYIELFQKRFAMTNQSLAEFRDKVKTSELALEKIGAEAKLLQSLSIYGELYPEVVSLRETVTKLSGQLRDLQKNLRQSDIGQRQDMLQIIVMPHLDLKSLSPLENDFSNLKSLLQQEIETNREIYNSIYKKLQEMELTNGSSVWVDLKVIQPANVSARPIRPNKSMNLLLGLLAGIMIGISLAFFSEYLDSSMRSVDDIKNYLKTSPLGLVPEVEFESNDFREMQSKAKTEGASRVMWNTHDIKIPLFVAEAYRIIRTNFIFGAIDKSLKVFQVTSAVKGEGKTTTSVNLGISLAQVGLKVLIVDADLRRPSLHRALHLSSNDKGLAQILKEGLPIEQAEQMTSVQNLHVIPSGGIPEHPAELLSSGTMKAFLEKVRGLYDVVLVDSPPLISVADSPIIASHVDGTIMVIRAGYIPRRLTMQAKKSVDAVNGKVLGIVLNSVSSSHHPYYYYRYYTDSYYTYYGAENEKGRKKRKKRSPIEEQKLGGFDRLRLSVLPFLPKGLREKIAYRDSRDYSKKV